MLWFGTVCAKGAMVSDKILQEKAQSLGDHLGKLSSLNTIQKFLYAQSFCRVNFIICQDLCASSNLLGETDFNYSCEW